ncbi:hypothetical protein HN807_03615 [Candidatus Bathyarchaeota archaeon]|nr:hypothetical protein [Candidatus Bathyarchaeota archaeon]MBT4321107.1 hypothetical protein [Candidatus Bathyarchaeota archaeon]MBT4424896.1 hypothetical protein [Candidatus Bathyarchaeota archaeon]MBT5642716.1 hypothetical protein [Candidatus Bathyarchaeota archaeon]MBT6603555.1 hypothetical protein [Candidatus Bathyarchaeota archaeon]
MSANIDVKLLSGLRDQIRAITPVLPDKAVVTVGQYALDTLNESEKLTEVDIYTLLRVLHRKDLQHRTVELDPEHSLQMDTMYEPHYWFDLGSYLEGVNMEGILGNLFYDYHKEILSISNISEGATAGILPEIHRHFMGKEKSTLGVCVFPSMAHSGDALYNAFSAVGRIRRDASTPLILVDQGKLEDYDGVHRDGDVLKGIDVLDYIIELLLDKEGFIRDLNKLSTSYNIELFSVLMASGCSMDIYESFRNILEITLEQPLMDFDITTAKMIYVLVKAPLKFRDELQKGQLEYEVSTWLQESIGIDIPQICESLFVDEFGDRLDVVILAGGYDSKEKFTIVHKRIERFSKMNLDQGLVKTEDWEEIKKVMLG